MDAGTEGVNNAPHGKRHVRVNVPLMSRHQTSRKGCSPPDLGTLSP